MSETDIIKEADLRKMIKSGLRPGAYLLFGGEDYMKAFSLRSAKEAICPDPTFELFNCMALEALDFTPAKLLDAMMPPPMMSDLKFISVTGLDFGSLKASDVDALCEALALCPEYDFNVIMISVPAGAIDEGYLPKRPSAILTKLSKYLTPVLFDTNTPASLAAWSQKHFAHEGVNAAPDVCAFLVDYAGTSMYSLASEIDKLCAYVLFHERHEVTKDDIRQVSVPAGDFDAFAFSNALTEGRHEDALNILGLMKQRRIEPLIILGDVSRTFSEMMSVKSLSEGGASQFEISKLLKIHEYKVGIYLKNLKNVPRERLLRSLELCAAADRAMKLSSPGYAPLERLICSL